jgi:hypothetical protein
MWSVSVPEQLFEKYGFNWHGFAEGAYGWITIGSNLIPVSDKQKKSYGPKGTVFEILSKDKPSSFTCVVKTGENKGYKFTAAKLWLEESTKPASKRASKWDRYLDNL